jgi:hypothetical protein
MITAIITAIEKIIFFMIFFKLNSIIKLSKKKRAKIKSFLKSI